MAGDIFFTDTLAWSSSSNSFVDIISRAIRMCGANDGLLVPILSNAEEIRCLDINLEKDYRLKAALTERVLDAARDALNEERAGQASPAYMVALEELATTAHEYLRHLGKSSD